MKKRIFTTNEVATGLGKSEETIRRWIRDGELEAERISSTSSTEKKKATYLITSTALEKLGERKPQYNEKIEIFLSNSIQSENSNHQVQNINVPKRFDIAELQKQLITQTIKELTPFMYEEIFSILGSNPEIITSWRKQQNKFYINSQPNMDEIITILTDVIGVATDFGLTVGETISSNKILQTFGRYPSEGINYYTKNNETFLLTKIGKDNRMLANAEYGDFWFNGKVFYEGRGQEDQKMSGMNKHLYNKYEWFYNRKLPLGETIGYVHLINTISENTSEKYVYLGRYYVTSWSVDSFSPNKKKSGEYKKAIIFTLTPISSYKTSNQ